MAPHVDGALPRRTHDAASGASSGTGTTPRLSADARTRSQQLATQFAAQIQLSMMETLSQLGSEGGIDEAGGEEGGDEDGGGELGIDAGGAGQLDLMATLFAAGAKSGMTTAQLQAQLATIGGAGGLGALTGAGAGQEAQLAQSLLASLSGATGAQAAGGAGSVGAAGSVDRGAAANAKVVAQVAREQGVDPTAAVAMMLVESGGRSTAVGDGGTSFGLFQLHEGGMLTAAGLSSTQAFDPRTNASVALRSLRHEWDKGHATRSPGEIAAASQRPADPAGYARKVDAAMDRARALLGS